MNKRVSDNIAELYFQTNKSRNAFTHAIGAGNGCVTNWINGKSDPNARWIPRIAKFFGVPIERLFEGVD